jgi:hypothetical protein
MKRVWKFFLAGILAWGGSVPPVLIAASPEPFRTQNQSPLIQIYGLPFIGPAALLPAKTLDAALVMDLANNYVQDSNPRENILLDGESTRITLQLRYGIARGWECTANIPYVFLSGGFLDGFIEGYHNLFGFPQGGRDQAPKNRLLYQYEKDGRERLQVEGSSSGLGDIRLGAGWQVFGEEGKSSALALRASLKLPTGDPGDLHGSGSWDLAVWTVASQDWKIKHGRLNLFEAAGAMGMTDGDVLEDQLRNLVGFGSLGIGWSPWRRITLKIQANGHTPFYKDSDLRELSASSVQLIMGGTLAFSDRTTLDLAVTEDIIVNTSPDVVFHLALQRRF